MGADFRIEPGQGDVSVVPSSRTYRLIFRRVTAPDDVKIEVNGVKREVTTHYAEAARNWVVELRGITPTDRVALTLRCIDQPWRDHTDRRAQRCRQMLHTFRMNVDAKRDLDKRLPQVLANPALLKTLGAAGRAAHIEALRSVLENEDL